MLSACAPASGTFQADKCDAFVLTVQLYWLRNISGTTAVRAVVRSHSLPLRIEGIVDYLVARFAIDSFPLRITNKNSEILQAQLAALSGRRGRPPRLTLAPSTGRNGRNAALC